MKRLLNTALFIVVVVTAVFLFAFITQFTRTGTTDLPEIRSISTQPAKVGTALDFALLPKGSSVLQVDTRIESEIGSEGHFDFWMSNAQDTPIELGVEQKSCNCADVRVALLTDDKLQANTPGRLTLRPWLAASALQLLGSAEPAGGFLAAVAGSHVALDTVATGVEWQTLTRNLSEGIAIPAHSLALFRINWKASERGTVEQRLTIDLWQQPAAAERSYGPKVEALVNFVSPIHLSRTELELPDALGPGEKRTVACRCWSSTRPEFSLKVTESSGDPCFECSVKPLSDAECREVETVLQTRCRSGYHIEVTVAESRQGHELDLGQFSRQLLLTTSATQKPPRVTVSGEVRGFLEVKAPRGRLDFGEFQLERAHDAEVILTSDRPQVRLKIASVEPEQLARMVQASIAPDAEAPGSNRWVLKAHIDARHAAGRFPGHGAIIVETIGDQPRRIRIPVTGQAVLRGTGAASPF